MKKILLLGLSILSINLQANSIMEDEVLWSYQEDYLSQMQTFQKEMKSYNQRLDNCRDIYYEKATKEDKEIYLKETNEFSTSVLTLNAILFQSVTTLESKMTNNKDEVMKNLKDYKETLKEMLHKEKTRNKNISQEYLKKIENIEKKYCKKK